MAVHSLCCFASFAVQKCLLLKYFWTVYVSKAVGTIYRATPLNTRWLTRNCFCFQTGSVRRAICSPILNIVFDWFSCLNLHCLPSVKSMFIAWGSQSLPCLQPGNFSVVEILVKQCRAITWQYSVSLVKQQWKCWMSKLRTLQEVNVTVISCIQF